MCLWQKSSQAKGLLYKECNPFVCRCGAGVFACVRPSLRLPPQTAMCCLRPEQPLAGASARRAGCAAQFGRRAVRFSRPSERRLCYSMINGPARTGGLATVVEVSCSANSGTGTKFPRRPVHWFQWLPGAEIRRPSPNWPNDQIRQLVARLATYCSFSSSGTPLTQSPRADPRSGE